MGPARLVPRLARLAALAALAAAGPCAAWDREIHLSLVRATIGISEAVEARVPLEHRDAIFRECQEPDFYDKECKYHCSSAEPKDAAAEAEKILAMLSDPKVVLRSYQRAQTIGRLLHYVADAVSPVELRQGAAPKQPNYFANQDFVFFRQARPLAGGVAEALRRRRQEVSLASDSPATAQPFVFRLAVNTMADALLLLPPRAEATGAADAGPVHFLVNRIDSGMAGKATSGRWEKSGHTYDNDFYGQRSIDSSGGYDVWTWTPGSKGGGQSFYKPNLLERKGVQLAELVAKREASSVTLRAILFNNSEMCAERVGLKAGAWSWSLPEPMPPGSLRAVTIEAPLDVISRRLSHIGSPTPCAPAKGGSTAIGTTGRLVYGNTGAAPLFDAASSETDISHGSAKAKPGINYSPSTRQ